MADKNLIVADDISYSYFTGFRLSSPSLIINHISFQLKRGEILAFLGSNGAGKSTTMRLLTGNIATHSGSISILGYDLKKQNTQAKRCIGYLPDTPPLYHDLKVDEYLNYCAKLHGLTQPQIKLSINHVKHRCGLDKVGHRLISQLSKGIQQRIGIAQAIVHQPDIIILDEPTNGLDPLQRHEILNLIKELGTEQSVILSTHSWSDVVQAGCNKVQIINQGKLVYKDSMDKFTQQLQSHTLTVCFCKPIDNKKILSIAGVLDIKAYNTSATCFKVYCDTSLVKSDLHKISSAIVDLSQQKGWQLYEIQIENKSFDEVFLSLVNQSSVNKKTEVLE